MPVFTQLNHDIESPIAHEQELSAAEIARQELVKHQQIAGGLELIEE
ncbi:hypothetical protein [Photobacterium jeanii]|nr:hypothetical protein [Photobacterium jeanii]